MIFNVWTFLFQVVNFLVLVYILRRLLYRPLREAIDRRREANAKAQADAEAARARRRGRSAAIDPAARGPGPAAPGRHPEGSRAGRGRTEDPHGRGGAGHPSPPRRKSSSSSSETVTRRSQSLHGELVHSAVALAGAIPEARPPIPRSSEQLAGRLVGELRAHPGRRAPAAARRVGRRRDSAVVEAAADVNGELLASIDGAVESLAGRPVNLSVRVQPDLLGGVRLRFGGHVWDASLADGLQEVKSAALRRGPRHERGRRAARQAGAHRPRLDRTGGAASRGRADVVSVGDGVGRVRGLPSVRFGELLERPDGLTGLAFDLRPHDVGRAVPRPVRSRLGGRRAACHRAGGERGRSARSCWAGWSTRLGGPLDGGPPIRSRTYRPVESEIAGIVDRQPVREPMHTGIKVIDALLPLGRGQRELILGDRATGKTSLALDAILAQRGTDVLCVYAAIGLRKTNVTEVVETLRSGGVLGQIGDRGGRRRLAARPAIPARRTRPARSANHFMQEGRHVLVVYDSLTTHADAYRRIALLLGRPPGREAYPPDVFYLHARLLERATRLHDRLGGGSLTALPIATTQAGNIAAYIPTNLISITDGQLYLDNHLFNEGVRPAVDVGLERLAGRRQGSAQAAPPAGQRPAPAVRPVARAGDVRTLRGRARAARPAVATSAAVASARRSNSRACARCASGHEAAVLFAVAEGYLDELAVEQVVGFLNALRQRLDEVDADWLDAIEHDDDLTPETKDRLQQAIASVQRSFTGSAPS